MREDLWKKLCGFVCKDKIKIKMRQPGIEPGLQDWES